MKKLLTTIWLASAALAAAQTNRPSVFPHGLIVTGDVTVVGGSLTAGTVSTDIVALNGIYGKYGLIEITDTLFFDGIGAVFYLTSSGLTMNADSYADLGVVSAARISAPTSSLDRLVVSNNVIVGGTSNKMTIDGAKLAHENGNELSIEGWWVSSDDTLFRLSADRLDGLDVTNFVLHTVIRPSSNTDPPAIPSAVYIFEDSADLWVWSPYHQRWRKTTLVEME